MLLAMLVCVIAYIFHWWLGLILFVSGLGLVGALVVGYLKVVTAAKYPNGKQRTEE